MTEPESRKSPARGGGAARTGKGGKKPGNQSRKQGSATPSRRARSIQQARVLAMQVIYEDDLTEHSLDDILQHLGEQQRQELTAAYADVRTRANGIIETIDFLARNIDADAGEANHQRFMEASDKALASLSEPDAGEEGERSDYVPPAQLRAEEITLPILRTYRDAVAANVRQVNQDSLEGDSGAQDAADLAAKLAALRGEPIPEPDDGAAEPVDALARLRFEAAHNVSATLANHERASRATMMEMVQRTGHLVHGITANRVTIDATIERAAPAYPIHQIASIDRNVLRVAVYELFHEPEVPYKVAVNEAVEIAKRYGGPNSGRFVNGVLRTVANGLPPARTGTKTG